METIVLILNAFCLNIHVVYSTQKKTDSPSVPNPFLPLLHRAGSLPFLPCNYCETVPTASLRTFKNRGLYALAGSHTSAVRAQRPMISLNVSGPVCFSLGKKPASSESDDGGLRWCLCLRTGPGLGDGAGPVRRFRRSFFTFLSFLSFVFFSFFFTGTSEACLQASSTACALAAKRNWALASRRVFWA